MISVYDIIKGNLGITVVIWEENIMNETIKATYIAHEGALSDVSAFDSGATARAVTFHRSLPMYEPTPLADLKCLAEGLGLGRVAVKDESKRAERVQGARRKLRRRNVSRAVPRTLRGRDDL